MAEAEESQVPQDLQYSEQHEWLSLDSDVGTVGITDYAQSQLGDVVFVELPEVGEILQAGQSFGTVEAVKAVEELYSPVSGEVVEINETLEDNPEQVNLDPYTGGWMIKVRLESRAELEQLSSAAEYEEYIKGG